MVDIWDENNVSFYQKTLASKFEGPNRLLFASIKIVGVSKAIIDGTDAKMMVCNTTENLLAPLGLANFGAVVLTS